MLVRSSVGVGLPTHGIEMVTNFSTATNCKQKEPINDTKTAAACSARRIIVIAMMYSRCARFCVQPSQQLLRWYS